MSQDLSGRTLGHYEVLEPLGAGGMADVYHGRDTKHRRAVAIKVLREDATSGLGVERFQEEIQITANLQHPHILQLYDSGEIDGRLYYVMPLVEGESLRERLRRGPLPIAEALEITRQIGTALQYAHDRDIVHRDVKPENVMLLSGQALVADFGIALALADVERTRLTAAGVSIGSPAYMSPEQAAGELDIDARTDVYALGAILYEMLTGAPPFPGEDVRSVLRSVISEVPRPASAINPGVSPAVSAVVASAMAKERTDRPASAAELIAQLDAANAPAGSGLSSRRARAVAALAAILVIGAGIVLALDWRSRQRDRDWARLEALPEVRRLLEESRIIDAFDLAVRVREILPDDPTLAGYLAAASAEIAIESEPQGGSRDLPSLRRR